MDLQTFLVFVLFRDPLLPPSSSITVRTVDPARSGHSYPASIFWLFLWQ